MIYVSIFERTLEMGSILNNHLTLGLGQLLMSWEVQPCQKFQECHPPWHCTRYVPLSRQTEVPSGFVHPSYMLVVILVMSQEDCFIYCYVMANRKYFECFGMIPIPNFSTLCPSIPPSFHPSFRPHSRSVSKFGINHLLSI